MAKYLNTIQFNLKKFNYFSTKSINYYHYEY